LGVRDQQRRTAYFQSMIDLRGLVAVVERRRGKPRLEAGQIMNKERPAVGQQRGHTVALSEAQRQILPGQPSRSLVQFPPRPTSFQGAQRRLVRLGFQANLEQTRELDWPF